MTTATYLPGQGVLVTIYGKREGLSVLIRDDMAISAIENNLRELEAWLE